MIHTQLFIYHQSRTMYMYQSKYNAHISLHVTFPAQCTFKLLGGTLINND